MHTHTHTDIHPRCPFVDEMFALLYLLHVGLKQISQALHQLREGRSLCGYSVPAIQHCLVAKSKTQLLRKEKDRSFTPKLFLSAAACFGRCLDSFGLRQLQIFMCWKSVLVSMWDAFSFHIPASTEPAGFLFSPNLKFGWQAPLVLLK